MRLTAAVVTVSDRGARGAQKDKSGPLMYTLLQKQGWTIARYQIIPDDPSLVIKCLRDCEALNIPLVVFTGSTGLGARDCVPDVLQAWADAPVPGFGEWMRLQGAQGNSRALLSRGGAWLRRGTLALALPGSPRGAEESFTFLAPVLEHALHIVAGGDHSADKEVLGAPDTNVVATYADGRALS